MYLCGYDWGPHGVDLATRRNRKVEHLATDPGNYSWQYGASYVAECLLTGKQSLITPEHALHVLEVMNATRESQATGRRIDIATTFPGRSSSRRHGTNSSRDRTADAACLSHLLPRDHRAEKSAGGTARRRVERLRGKLPAAVLRRYAGKIRHSLEAAQPHRAETLDDPAALWQRLLPLLGDEPSRLVRRGQRRTTCGAKSSASRSIGCGGWN